MLKHRKYDIILFDKEIEVWSFCLLDYSQNN